jgi:hypothetical protein
VRTVSPILVLVEVPPSGEWKDDLRHGWGILYYPNGDIYEGNFVQGKKHGEVFSLPSPPDGRLTSLSVCLSVRE